MIPVIVSILILGGFGLTQQAFAAIALVDSTENIQNAVSGDLTTTVPAGVVDGDLMIAFLWHQDDDPAVSIDSVPAGWTLQRDKTNMGNTGQSDPVVWIYTRTASSEPADYSWSWNQSGAKLGYIVAFSGADTATAVDQDLFNAQTGVGTDPISPALTTNNDGDVVIAYAFGDTGGNVNFITATPAALIPIDNGTATTSNSNGIGLYAGLGYETIATAGTTAGSYTWTSNQNDARSAGTISIVETTGSGQEFTVSFELASSSVGEAGGAHNISVVLNSDGSTLSQVLTVDVVDSFTGSANSGIDYTVFGTQTVTFQIGDGNGTTKTVTLNVMNNLNFELDEDVDLLLTNLVGPASVSFVSPTVHEVTILDDDPSPSMPIGGTSLPIDTTSLLLAGASVNAWMIPVVLSAAGFGILIARKI